MTWDVILYADDPAGAFSPTLNASKPTGGTEVHMVQLAEGLGGSGLNVAGVSLSVAQERTANAMYSSPPAPPPERYPSESRALITAACTMPPPWLKTDRHVVLWTHDPPHNIPFLEAAGRRWSEFVCVSRWQADRFPRGWKTRVIPAIIDDWIYDLPPLEKDSRCFVCVSAWWKGTQQTLDLWAQLRPPGTELLVGSPYSHPPDARTRVERVPGARWIDLANPRAVVAAMRVAVGVFRVSMAPETFGVTDAIAQILGCRTHVLCPADLGAIPEVLAPTPWVTQNIEEFVAGFRSAFASSAPLHIQPRDFRARKIIPQWIELLDLPL